MIVPASAQTAVRNVRITGHEAAEALLAFTRDARHFVEDNLLLLAALVVLVVVVFQVTRPRVR
jgi:hypothetical protein